MTYNNRLEGIDFLRAIAILLVVFGHVFPELNLYFVLTSPIKIPLFFYISGFLFRSDRAPSIFVKNMFRKLVVPWVVIGLIPILLQTPFLGLNGLFARTWNYISGIDYWFMPCLIMAELIWFALTKIVKTSLLRFVISLLLLLVGYHFVTLDFLNVFMVNRALICQFFVCQGFLLKEYSNTINNNLSITVLGICYFIVSLLINNVWPQVPVDFHNNIYNCFPINIIQTVAGCGCLMLVFESKVKAIPHAIQIIGMNTLVVYLYHVYVIALLNKSLSLLGLDCNLIPVRLLFVLLSITICCCLSVMLKKHIPLLFGMNHK